MSLSLFALLLLDVNPVFGGGVVETNQIKITDAPDWVKLSQVQRTVDRVEHFLEWDIRSVQGLWVASEADFMKLHGMGPSVTAFTRKQNQTIYFGPQVNAQNFESIFAHELVHIVLAQKFKTAIPVWLDEGLANFVARKGAVQYDKILARGIPKVQTLSHPFKSADPSFQYMVSLAFMQMLNSRCKIQDLLQLALQKRLETYIQNTCGLEDMDAPFEKWVRQQASLVGSGVGTVKKSQ